MYQKGSYSEFVFFLLIVLIKKFILLGQALLFLLSFGGVALLYNITLLNFNYVLQKHLSSLWDDEKHTLSFLPTLNSYGAVINYHLRFILRNNLLHFPLLKERIGEVKFALISASVKVPHWYAAQECDATMMSKASMPVPKKNYLLTFSFIFFPANAFL